MWYSIQKQGDVTRVSITGEIDCYSQTAEQFLAELGDAKTVELFINSPGGDSATARRIAWHLHRLDVTATVTHAASAAVIFLLGCRRVRIHQNARLMVHGCQDFVCGPPAELRRRARETEGWNSELAEWFHLRTGQPREVTARWLSGPDHWFSAAQAVECGLADEIIEPPALSPATQAALADDAPQQTQDEKTFWQVLRAFDRLAVKDRQSFGRNLHVWLTHSVYEKNPR